MNIILWNI